MGFQLEQNRREEKLDHGINVLSACIINRKCYNKTMKKIKKAKKSSKKTEKIPEILKSIMIDTRGCKEKKSSTKILEELRYGHCYSR